MLIAHLRVSWRSGSNLLMDGGSIRRSQCHHFQKYNRIGGYLGRVGLGDEEHAPATTRDHGPVCIRMIEVLFPMVFQLAARGPLCDDRE